MKTLLKSAIILFASVSFTLAGGDGWPTDWEAAKAKSKAENKPILINLTGSDWCGWCIKVEKDVFSQKEFKDFAAEHLVLMEADFPRKKKQPAELEKQNKALEKKYLNEGYPTIWLLDSEGNKLSQEDLGEFKANAEDYVKHLKELLSKIKAAK